MDRHGELIAEIYAAFEKVTLADGVSWTDSIDIDLFWGPAASKQATPLEQDSTWHGLVGDPNWSPEAGNGGWNFLDPIGFRYYLPAAMLRCLSARHDQGIVYHLTLDEVGPVPYNGHQPVDTKFSKEQMREYTFYKWSALDQRQRYCVKTFLLAMVDIQRTFDGLEEPNDWEEALASYWSEVD